jgi:hypothetical protein
VGDGVELFQELDGFQVLAPAMAGARVVCKDTQHLREVLSVKIQSIPGIQRTETFISLEESIDRPINILEEGEEID